MGGKEVIFMSKRKSNRPRRAGVIFRPWRVDPKTGDKLWARDYGLKAWPIPIGSSDRDRKIA